MSTPLDLGNTATRRARVMIGPGAPLPLPMLVEEAIQRVVVETSSFAPGMFEITFRDNDGKITEAAGIAIGSAVSIAAEGGIAQAAPKTIITGDVIAIEASCTGLLSQTTVRGYERSLRLQRVRKTRTFVDMTDYDMAVEIAMNAELVPGEMVETPYVYTHMTQFNQTDWDFLQWRAQEIGYEVGIDEGALYFRPSSGTVEGAALDDAEALEHPAVPLEFKRNLLEFFPSVSAAGLTQSVEVRAWDPGLAEPLIGELAAESTTAEVLENPVVLATQAWGEELPTLPVMSTSILNPAELSPPVDPEAYLVYDRPLDTGVTAETAMEIFAQSLADQRASTFLEAEGYAVGDPNIQAGGPVEIFAVPARFIGVYQVTRTRHTFDDETGGYRTRFWVTGRHNRSLLGLASGGDQIRPPRINGVVCGIVTNNLDTGLPPRGRVKLAFPWLSPDYESDWAPVVQAGAGPTSGLLWLPQVDDQVLVAFEFGDIRRPYVLGGVASDLASEAMEAGLGAPAVESELGAVTRRGMYSPSGMNLTFTDVAAAPDTPPEMSEITLGSFEGAIGVTINQTDGTVSLTGGAVSIEAAEFSFKGTRMDFEAAEGLSIKAGAQFSLTAGGEMSINAGGALSVAGEGELNMSAVGNLSMEAPFIELNA
ncbi:phage baseplate assembly protein V [Streptomyces sp. NPDC047028]|uniref:phage baseplate assembly protein V n=1 Tax=Streptomyces sp. NPDC047028 TaxID=3155793 RepID=UPI0033EE3557